MQYFFIHKSAIFTKVTYFARRIMLYTCASAPARTHTHVHVFFMIILQKYVIIISRKIEQIEYCCNAKLFQVY